MRSTTSGDSTGHMARLLLADDDRSVLVMLSSWLKLEDQHTVDTASNGEEALSFLEAYSYDIVILDWEMPKIAGVEVCRRFKEKNPGVPVLMLTGKDTVQDKVQGLNAGADDYLTKPFQAEELSARVRALLRRGNKQETAALVSGAVSLEPLAKRVTIKGAELRLSPTEFALLEFFLTNPDQSFSPEALLSRIWAGADDATIASVRVTVNRLRTKLEGALGNAPLTTVRGSGYSWDSSLS